MKRLFIALLIIVTGIVLLFANLDLFNMRAIANDWWPILIIMAGGISLIGNRTNVVWPLFIMGLGTLILLNTLGVADVEIGKIVWPAIVIGFGITMLLSSLGPRKRIQNTGDDITVIMAGTTNKNVANDYRGCKATAVMGGIEMDISHAIIKKEAIIDVFVLMGGVELRVPENVIVKSRATCFLAGIEDKTNPLKTPDAPVLYVDGTIIMGGIEIKR
jgi:hypothetical protein